MAWYVWVAIAAAVILLAVVKIGVGSAWLRRRKERQAQREQLKEDDDT